MPDLDQIIDFDTSLNPGSADGGPVNRCVGAHFDIIVDLNNTTWGIFTFSCPGRAKPKPSLPTTTPAWRITRLPMRHRR